MPKGQTVAVPYSITLSLAELTCILPLPVEMHNTLCVMHIKSNAFCVYKFFVLNASKTYKESISEKQRDQLSKINKSVLALTGPHSQGKGANAISDASSKYYHVELFSRFVDFHSVLLGKKEDEVNIGNARPSRRKGHTQIISRVIKKILVKMTGAKAITITK